MGKPGVFCDQWVSQGYFVTRGQARGSCDQWANQGGSYCQWANKGGIFSNFMHLQVVCGSPGYSFRKFENKIDFGPKVLVRDHFKGPYFQKIPGDK